MYSTWPGYNSHRGIQYLNGQEEVGGLSAVKSFIQWCIGGFPNILRIISRFEQDPFLLVAKKGHSNTN